MQLMDISGSSLIVGLADHAFVLTSQQNPKQTLVIELLASKSEITDNVNEDDCKKAQRARKRVTGEDNDDEGSGQDDNDDEDASSNGKILVVALSRSTHDGTMLCAVARADKSVSLYQCVINEVMEGSQLIKILPYMVHRASKRISSIIFSQFPSQTADTTILLVGDALGDVFAFPVSKECPPGIRRHLLGHTASVITSIRVIAPSARRNMQILSADRDEKIRISSFPDAYKIDGYLLGHEEFISDMDVKIVSTLGKEYILCVSCSGDMTLRLWDVNDFSEISTLIPRNGNTKLEREDELNIDDGGRLVPFKLSMNVSVSLLAVIYEDANHVDIVRIVGPWNSDCLQTSMNKIQSISCKYRPIGVNFQNDNTLFVLMQGSGFLARYDLLMDDTVIDVVSIEDCSLCHALRHNVENQIISFPSTISDMRKLNRKIPRTEKHRTPGQQLPERVKLLKQKGARRKRKFRDK